MATDRTAPGAARIVKTQRVAHVITAGDGAANQAVVDVVWDSPFVDLNHTVDANVEAIAPADPSLYYVAGFTRDVNKLTVIVGCTVQGVGDAVVVHAHGIHD